MHDCLDKSEHLSVPAVMAASLWRPPGAWFCLTSHPKREHIAAAQLRQDPEIDVFLPRIRYKRCMRFGPVWTTEALFRNYFFACFDLETCLRRVQGARSVRGVVRFGERYPTIPA